MARARSRAARAGTAQSTALVTLHQPQLIHLCIYLSRQRDAGRYLITVALPPAGFGRPIDLTLQGDRLSLAGGALDFAGFRLGRFQLTSSTGADAVVEVRLFTPISHARRTSD